MNGPVILVGLVLVAVIAGLGFFTFSMLGDIIAPTQVSSQLPADDTNQTQDTVSEQIHQESMQPSPSSDFMKPATTNLTLSEEKEPEEDETPSFTGGGGGGGSPPAAAPPAPPCQPTWSCGNWSGCTGGNMTRDCSDGCGHTREEAEDCMDAAGEPIRVNLSVEEESYTIYIEGNFSELYAFSVRIENNGSLINFTGSESGDMLSSDGEDVYIARSSGQGYEEYGETRFGTDAGITAEGTLCSFTFSGTGQGNAELVVWASLVGSDLNESGDDVEIEVLME